MLFGPSQAAVSRWPTESLMIRFSPTRTGLITCIVSGSIKWAGNLGDSSSSRNTHSVGGSIARELLFISTGNNSPPTTKSTMTNARAKDMIMVCHNTLKVAIKRVFCPPHPDGISCVTAAAKDVISIVADSSLYTMSGALS